MTAPQGWEGKFIELVGHLLDFGNRSRRYVKQDMLDDLTRELVQCDGHVARKYKIK